MLPAALSLGENMCHENYDPDLDVVPEEEELRYGLGFDPNADRWVRNLKRLEDLIHENEILNQAVDVLENAVEYWQHEAESYKEDFLEGDDTVG